MKLFRLGLWFGLTGVMLLVGDLGAVSIDGTSSTQYKATTQIFRRGLDEYVRGFVRLGNGFAVASRASAFMDTNISVSGQMDLGETGTLILLNNLNFERSITLTSGGNIKGKATVSGDAKTIFLGGDMTLSATTYSRVLHIMGDWCNSGTSGDLVIDGRGHTLDIQDRAQIFVDTNITLTLRNMTIRTGPKSLMTPPIRLAAHGSKLTLDNVLFDLGADFQFKQGQIFVHNEVAVTGTSAFIYQSPRPSYITSGATWSFEYGTTFSVAPATFTDCPYTLNNTYTNNNFIVLADASSTLSLNSCSFKTTFTGLRLTKGMVLFDNRVVVDTMAGVYIPNSVSAVDVTGGGYAVGELPRYVSWAPNGKFLAVGTNSNKLQIYRFDGSSLALMSSIFPSFPLGGGLTGIYWSPDGRFLLAPAFANNLIRIYKFTGNSSPTFVTVMSLDPTTTYPTQLAWSPDGRFFATVNTYATPRTISVYKFDGISSPTLVDQPNAGGIPFNLAWSPDGRHIAVTDGSNPGYLMVFRFDGKSKVRLVGSVQTQHQFPAAVAWSPDGRFIVVGSYVYYYIEVYKFSGNGAPVLTSQPPAGAYQETVSFSPDGKYVLVSNNGNTIQVYAFSGKEFESLGTITTADNCSSTAWSPDGKYIVALNGGTTNKIQVFRVNFYYTGQPNQAFTSSLIFGNSAKGSSCNANVRVLPGASVALQGKVTDDSA